MAVLWTNVVGWSEDTIAGTERSCIDDLVCVVVSVVESDVTNCM